jgi:hypothetical protein
MKQKILFKLTAIAIILPFQLILSYTQKQNWPQFRGPDDNMVVASANLPEKWSNDTNIIWKTPLDGAGFSSPIVWGNKVFITSTFPVKVNPVPERGPMQGPSPEGGQGPQPGQGPQQGQGPQPGQGMPQPGQGPQGVRGPQPGMAEPPQDIPDTSFKKKIYRWELRCFDLKTGGDIVIPSPAGNEELLYMGYPGGRHRTIEKNVLGCALSLRRLSLLSLDLAPFGCCP